MARIKGIAPERSPWLMRMVFARVRKTVGKDLTPLTIQARVPRVFWVNVLTEWLLGQKAAISPRHRSLIQLRTASRVGCPF